MNRQRFIASLRKRFSLRLHMTLILMATSMAGVLASKGMLAVGLHNVALRYPITVLFAYLVFFAAIKIWLWLMTDAPVSSSTDTGNNLLNNIDIPLPSGTGGSRSRPSRVSAAALTAAGPVRISDSWRRGLEVVSLPLTHF